MPDNIETPNENVELTEREKTDIIRRSNGFGDITKANEEKRRQLILRQDRFVHAMIQCSFNVSKACRKIGISRRTFYAWRNNNDGVGSYATDEKGEVILFAERISEVEEEKLDFVEEKLHQRITHGDTPAIMFYLETKGRTRGYDRRQRIDVHKYDNVTKEQKDAAMQAIFKQADGSVQGVNGPVDIVKKLVEDSIKKSEDIINIETNTNESSSV